MHQARMDAAIGLLKLKGTPILYAHENGAWWINTQNSEIINKIKRLKRIVFSVLLDCKL